jgi:ArsR family transcriptional regulator
MCIIAFVKRELLAFKAAGEPARLRILRILIEADTEVCACEIIDTLEKPQYAVSKGLGVLTRAGLVEERREGRQMMYSLIPGEFNDRLFRTITSLACKDGEIAGDLRRLKARLAKRANGKCVTGCA